MISRIILKSSLPCRNTLPWRSLFSRGLADKPKFDAEMSEMYVIIANQHRHPQGPWPMILERAKKHLSSNPSPKILDIASGMGEPALTIATSLPSAQVVSSDVSEEMVLKAKSVAETMDNMTAVLANAEDLSQFDTDTFDMVTCCYGYMFAENKPQALSESHRVLKPGGTLIATTWDSNDLMSVQRDVMKVVLGRDPPAPLLNPLSLNEPGLFSKLLADAGFTNITSSTSTYPFNLGKDKNFQWKMLTMLYKDKIAELGAEDTAKHAFFDIVPKYSVIENGDLVIPKNTFMLTVCNK
uniref:Methyltransferase domain-containing protein n=1 Tax=Fibrocapsa japonica TaxID=94617 RepID=A0A6U1PI47_9STRA|mmetsp:Transcript_4494/g.6735  ORF Transcript_4494/g.6735 Transcript_4494/m.6735 type:complete len:297 (+) Transcript_4494:69-959(+)